MKNYDFPMQFRVLYDRAVALYAQGQRDAKNYFDKAQTAWLKELRKRAHIDVRY